MQTNRLKGRVTMKTTKEMKVITEEATPGPSGSAGRGRVKDAGDVFCRRQTCP